MKHEMTNDGIARAAQALAPRAAKSLLKPIEHIIRCSMLDVRCSTFISFFLDLTGGSRPAPPPLTPET
jgi:hypothetical protein